MRRRAEAARRRRFQFDPFEKAVEGKIEIQAGLLPVGDYVEAGIELVVNCGDDGVFDQFLTVGLAKLVEVLAGKLQPTGEGVTADNGGAQGWGRHGGRVMKDEL